jgi:hypothetical protein
MYTQTTLQGKLPCMAMPTPAHGNTLPAGRWRAPCADALHAVTCLNQANLIKRPMLLPCNRLMAAPSSLTPPPPPLPMPSPLILLTHCSLVLTRSAHLHPMLLLTWHGLLGGQVMQQTPTLHLPYLLHQQATSLLAGMNGTWCHSGDPIGAPWDARATASLLWGQSSTHRVPLCVGSGPPGEGAFDRSFQGVKRLRIQEVWFIGVLVGSCCPEAAVQSHPKSLPLQPLCSAVQNLDHQTRQYMDNGCAGEHTLLLYSLRGAGREAPGTCN